MRTRVEKWYDKQAAVVFGSGSGVSAMMVFGAGRKRSGRGADDRERSQRT